MVAPGGACMVAPGGGMCGCSGGVRACTGGHAWLLWGACVVALGGHAWDTTAHGDTVNERVVHILLECILVLKLHVDWSGHSNPTIRKKLNFFALAGGGC